MTLQHGALQQLRRLLINAHCVAVGVRGVCVRLFTIDLLRALSLVRNSR